MLSAASSALLQLEWLGAGHHPHFCQASLQLSSKPIAYFARTPSVLQLLQSFVLSLLPSFCSFAACLGFERWRCVEMGYDLSGKRGPWISEHRGSIDKRYTACLDLLALSWWRHWQYLCLAQVMALLNAWSWCQHCCRQHSLVFGHRRTHWGSFIYFRCVIGTGSTQI